MKSIFLENIEEEFGKGAGIRNLKRISEALNGQRDRRLSVGSTFIPCKKKKKKNPRIKFQLAMSESASKPAESVIERCNHDTKKPEL
jgi:hypothetical protein